MSRTSFATKDSTKHTYDSHSKACVSLYSLGNLPVLGTNLTNQYKKRETGQRVGSWDSGRT